MKRLYLSRYLNEVCEQLCRKKIDSKIKGYDLWVELVCLRKRIEGCLCGYYVVSKNQSGRKGIQIGS